MAIFQTWLLDKNTSSDPIMPSKKIYVPIIPSDFHVFETHWETLRMMPVSLLRNAHELILVEAQPPIYKRVERDRAQYYIYMAGLSVKSNVSSHTFVRKYVFSLQPKGDVASEAPEVAATPEVVVAATAATSSSSSSSSSPSNPRHPELQREYNIGQEMNTLRDILPTFVFTLPVFHIGTVDGPCKNQEAITIEYCNTMPLHKQLNSSKKSDTHTTVDLGYFLLNMNIDYTEPGRKQFISLFAQLVSAWSIAYDRLGFVSNDAHLKNILIDLKTPYGTIPFPVTIDGVKKTYYIQTFGAMARHIDYGKARTNQHHSRHEPHNVHWTHDVFRLIGFVSAWAFVCQNEKISGFCERVSRLFPDVLRAKLVNFKHRRSNESREKWITHIIDKRKHWTLTKLIKPSEFTPPTLPALLAIAHEVMLSPQQYDPKKHGKAWSDSNIQTQFTK